MRLRDDQILESSVVMITGDHGEAFGEHGTYYHGTTVYDEQIKVPLLVRVGAKLPELAKGFGNESANGRDRCRLKPDHFGYRRR